VDGTEATGRWRGVLGGPGNTPASNRGQVNARQGKIRAGLGRLPWGKSQERTNGGRGTMRARVDSDGDRAAVVNR
jgi:hypothetical protein